MSLRGLGFGPKQTPTKDPQELLETKRDCVWLARLRRRDRGAYLRALHHSTPPVREQRLQDEGNPGEDGAQDFDPVSELQIEEVRMLQGAQEEMTSLRELLRQRDDQICELSSSLQKERERFCLEAWWRIHVDWSARTFGPAECRGPVGPIRHLEKEVQELLEEALADPTSLNFLEEATDLIHLVIDACWRAGHTFHEFASMLQHKQEKNRQRKWPDWRLAPPDTAIEHVRGEGEKASVLVDGEPYHVKLQEDEAEAEG